jgi:DNA-binding winged helix-turn-helix (wHTH) protein/TolB-like protein
LKAAIKSSEERSIVFQLFLKAVMSNSVKHFYDFGPFRIDVANRLLLRDGQPLPLTPKAVDTLLALVQYGGEVLKKDELMKLVWPDSVVEEGNLTQNIYLLRKTLGEGSNGENYIETVPRRGYRFVGEVRKSQDEAAELILAERTKVQVVIEEQEEGGSDAETPRHGDTETTEPGNNGFLSASPPLLIPLSSSLPHRRRLSIPVLLTTIILVVIAALFYLTFSGRPKPPETKATIESIAVLPFKPLGTGSGDQDLGVGMADALITQLSNIRRIIVRPTSAVLKYGSSNQDLLAVGRELNVDALLDGKFQRADGRLRVTVQLVSVHDGAPLWAEKFDEEFTNMLAVQDAIAQRVTQALALKLSSEEQKLLAKRFTENPEAYQAYLQGRSHWNRRTTPAFEKAIEYFEQALRYDPSYALAYAGLADVYALLGFRYNAHEQRQSDAMPKAKAAAIRALQLNDLLAEAHTALAVVKQSYDWDFAGAESEFKRAIALNPNYAHAHQAYALHLLAMGRLDAAKAEIKRAQELDPLSFPINKDLGDILYLARSYEYAIGQYRRTLKMASDDPLLPSLRRMLGWAYQHQGMHEPAVTEFIELLRMQEVKSEHLVALRQAYEAAGIKGYWRKWLEWQRDRIMRGQRSPFYLAQIYAFLGEKEQAFACLEKAYEDRSISLAALRLSPNFDGLRADSRYTALMQRIGLKP